MPPVPGEPEPPKLSLGPELSLPYDQPVQPVQPPLSDADLARPFRPAVPPAPVALSPNTAGRISFIIGIGITVLSVIQQIVVSVIPALLYRAGGDVVGVSQISFGVFSVLVGILAIAGTAFGIVGLMRRDAHRIGAAAGTAIAVTTLLSVVVAVIVSASVALLY